MMLSNVVINRGLVRELFRLPEKKCQDCLTLHVFYSLHASDKGYVLMTVEDTAEVLGWSIKRIHRARSLLKSMGAWKGVTVRSKGKILGHGLYSLVNDSGFTLAESKFDPKEIKKKGSMANNSGFTLAGSGFDLGEVEKKGSMAKVPRSTMAESGFDPEEKVRNISEKEKQNRKENKEKKQKKEKERSKEKERRIRKETKEKKRKKETCYARTRVYENPSNDLDREDVQYLNLFPKSFRESKVFTQTWADYLQHRKEKRNKLTPIAAKRLTTMLTKLSRNEAMEAIERSMTNGWTGVFPPKVEGERGRKESNKYSGFKTSLLNNEEDLNDTKRGSGKKAGKSGEFRSSTKVRKCRVG